MSANPVAIVGAGAMGHALGRALAAAGVSIEAVASRTATHAEALARAVRGARVVDFRSASRAGSIVLLTVSDSAIEEACAAIEAEEGTLVAHVSGSRDVSALEAARVRGADVGGFHPLAAVARGAQAVRDGDHSPFEGALFAIEGDAGVAERLGSLATALGGHPFRIAAADKPRYHLGASMLAAFSAGLAQIAWDQLRRAGAEPDVASRAVGHLLGTVADNIARAPRPSAALTGPAARGDAEGVARQAAAAGELSEEARALYRVHALHNIALVRDTEAVDSEVRARMVAALRRVEAAAAPEGDA